MLRRDNLGIQNMPQDGLRSVGYRSFVTCDDPKGVVECGTIRKTKSGSQKMEHKIESQRTMKKSNANLARYKAEKEETTSKRYSQKFHNPSSFELLEVSRGAQKLNQVIDSWCKGPKYDGHSKDIAKDLLKGALDLQESLLMLEKFQEASHYMSRLKNKDKEKSDVVKSKEVMWRTDSSRFGKKSPRPSANGSSQDCIEELREVIRTSLARQNLLPNKKTDENVYFSRRNVDSASDIPSTSSSQSSVLHGSNFSSSNSLISSAAPEKKAKGPSLIAKLMGLEEFPSKPLQATSQKQLESEKIFNQQRPVFDIDMPKVRKPQFVCQKHYPEKRTLKEILETMHFKGLLKRNSVKELKSHSHDSFSAQRLVDYNAPIVLIKPFPDPYLQAKQSSTPVFGNERTLSSESMLLKQNVKQELPSRTFDHKEGALNSNRMSWKMEAQETALNRHTPAGAKESKKTETTKSEKKEVKAKKQLSSKMNSSGPVTQQLQKKDAIDKKSEKTSKLAKTTRKALEKAITKAKDSSRNQDQAKVASPKPNKLENGTNVTKKIPRQQNAVSNSISTRKSKTTFCGPTDLKRSPVKKEKPGSKPKEDKITIQNSGCKGDEKSFDFVLKNDSVSLENSITTADQNSLEEGTESCKIQIRDVEPFKNSQSSLSDVTPLTAENQTDIKSVKEVEGHISPLETDSKCLIGTTLKQLLLSSPPFLSHAEELFDLNVNISTDLEASGAIDFADANTRLSLDFANEFIQRRSCPDSQTISPIHFGYVRIRVTLDHLLEEFGNGVQTLRSYSELARQKLPADSLHATLERDIKCREILSGTWDLGWRNGFSVDDTDQVVNDIEKLLLSALVEEILA